MTKQDLLTIYAVGDVINNPIITEFIAGELESFETYGN